MSQREMENRTGIRQSHLSRIENGLVDPKLSHAAHVNPESFVRTATETADRFRDTWEDAARSLPVADAVGDAIRSQLARVPAIAGVRRKRRRRTGPRIR